MEIVSLTELPDGSASITIDLTAEEIMLFAKEGILSVFTKSAERIIKEHSVIEEEEISE
jgi:hypothetical protein